jgi:glycerol-3-phosphate dehydrogenase
VEHKVPYEAFVAVFDGSPGTRRLRAVLGAKAVPTRSMAEDRMEALLDRHGFPPREHNAEVAGETADVLFADARLIVEVDSRGFHTSQIAQENDRRKQARGRRPATRCCASRATSSSTTPSARSSASPCARRATLTATFCADGCTKRRNVVGS